jgi:uncharacterized integral membrane protein
MRNFLKFLLIAPIAVIFLSFDMANRQNVVVSFDPFNSADAPQIVVPLFIVLIAAAMFGVVLGGVATWFGQGRFRKAARGANATTETLRNENEALRKQLAELKSAGSAPSTAVVVKRSAA